MGEYLGREPFRWPLVIGECSSLQSLQEVVGGSRQWGITSCMSGLHFLVFHNPHSARKNGYDRWEGFQPDGSFHYTGQGRVGDQSIDQGANKSLLSTLGTSTPIYLLRSEGTSVTYLGKFCLSDNPCRIERALDSQGNERSVVVFHLETMKH